ncbi:MAG: hypothetical protein EA355_00855 [Rhodobacteraceae bacterium]|nr:MAG: hypothetical protein EA355_00855 [Paracoccaceae bacterium]
MTTVRATDRDAARLAALLARGRRERARAASAPIAGLSVAVRKALGHGPSLRPAVKPAGRAAQPC